MKDLINPDTKSFLLKAYSIVVIAIGGIFLIYISGLIFEASLLPSAHYGSAMMYAGTYGFAVFLLLKICKVNVTSSFTLLLIPIFWIGPVIVGHYEGYSSAKAWVWNQTQKDTEGFPSKWKSLSQAETFARFVKMKIGEDSAGYWGYLKLMAHWGWHGSERTAYTIHRTGFWAWLSWIMYLLFILIGVITAYGAALPEESKIALKRKKIPSIKKQKTETTTTPMNRPQTTMVQKYQQLCSIVIPGAESNYWLVELHFEGRNINLEIFWELGQPKTIDIAYHIALQINQVHEWIDPEPVETVSTQHHEMLKMEKKMTYLFNNSTYMKGFLQQDERFFATKVEH